MTVADEVTIEGGRPLRGRLRLPGCKGISHRALVFAAIAEGSSRIGHLAPGDDVARTHAALEALGVVTDTVGETVVVEGRGIDALAAPTRAIECGNSGTTMRMLAGLLAGRPFSSELAGDASLSSRPMARVVDPLRAMGADITGSGDGSRAPLSIRGGPLHGARHDLAVASGQVKTALVLAGLQADGETLIVEPAPSRDHTERLLGGLGAPVERIDDHTLRVHAGSPRPFELEVPGDPSSAAYFAAAAAIVPGSQIVLEGVALNPGRTAYLDVLRAMGASVETSVVGEHLGEPFGDVEIAAAPLRGVEIVGSEAIVDELPVLAVAGAFAAGTTTISGAAELRVKESDRIATLDQELAQLGVRVDPRPDGLVIEGGSAHAGTLKSHGDHRIAMAVAVAACALSGQSVVRGWAAVAVSYPNFAADLLTLGAEIR